MAIEVTIVGIKELKAAIDRNPEKIKTQAGTFLARSIAAYKSGINNNPWRRGGSGGGAPVKSGTLRDTHRTKISGFEARIGPNTQRAPYARFVYFGTRYMKPGRPWLEYVKRTKDSEVQNLYHAMLDEIVADLAK